MSHEVDRNKSIADAIRKSLSFFFKKSFCSLHPSIKYDHNWHIDLLCEYLTACANGEISRLNINIPPRFLKTELCNVAFSMWLLGNDPTKSVIGCCYSGELSEAIHNKCRSISRTEWFQLIFKDFNIYKDFSNDVIITKDTQKKFVTTKGGSRYSTSTQATITGEGADFIILDDLINPQEAQSEAERRHSLDWCRDSVFSRFNNPSQGCIVNVQQRVHLNDFVGELVNEDWVTVDMPIMFDKRRVYSFGNFRKECQEGELLQPNRFGEKEIDIYKRQLGETNRGKFIFSSQYMQNPIPDGGTVIKSEWFKHYSVLPPLEYRNIYMDTAMKTKESNDYTVMQCWGYGKDGKAYLIDQVRGKWEAPELERYAVDFWNKHRSTEGDVGVLRAMAIEDKSSGTGLIQKLRRDYKIPVIEIKVDKDKIVRANDAAIYFCGGFVLFPSKAPFLLDLKEEMCIFPDGKHDDQVDTTCHAINHIFGKKQLTPRVVGTI